MARPKKQGLDYFPHDTDASDDEKIKGLEIIHGIIGYAFYFKTLENIYSSGRPMDLSNPIFMKVHANNLKIKEEEYKNIIETAVELGLFDSEDWKTNKMLYSNPIDSRLSSVNTRRKFEKGRQKHKRVSAIKELKEYIFKRDGNKCLKCGENNVKKLVIDHAIPKCLGGSDGEDNLQTLCSGCNMIKGNKIENLIVGATMIDVAANTPIKERKVKESKVNKRKEENCDKTQFLDFVFLRKEEHVKLVSQFGQKVVDIQIRNLNNYIGSKGKKYKSHYHTILTWINKNGLPEEAKKGTPRKEDPLAKVKEWQEEEKRMQENENIF